MIEEHGKLECELYIIYILYIKYPSYRLNGYPAFSPTYYIFTNRNTTISESDFCVKHTAFL
jgi:hypothetical protein